MGAEDQEIFAQIRIDTPSGEDAGRAGGGMMEPKAAEAKGASFWHRPICPVIPADEEEYLKLAPKEGEPFRMAPLGEVLKLLKISIGDAEDGYLDDGATEALRIRLNRIGLAMATEISGPLKLRLSDVIPIVQRGAPQPSRYSSITVCLYIVAWMLEADAVTPRELAVADEWIGRFDPKADWTGSASGTLRWLLSRKLFMTAKRKHRMGRVKRYPNVRAKLLDCLLTLVSDPETATPKRMKRLETIYTVLDLNPADIHADIHRLATLSKTPSKVKSHSASANALDPSLLKRMEQSTLKAQDILASVFSQDQSAESEEIENAEQHVQSPVAQALQMLSERESYSRDEAEEIAKRVGMTLGAMLERVNDISYEIADEAVADDDGDTIYIDSGIAAQCLEKLEKS